eukprot:TRINITY_DN1097_c0_g1_i4.p1 TRINITY_DN1097_c0_g1~~TRINITY_DN1097_c0_g1_i4.p1  ORF type:complete len:260 (+),score=38.74 TRINITY_DN1097_c0_g1_i4:1175-1954(+)
MPSIELSEEIRKHFAIKNYKQANPGGQKTVFIVNIGDIEYALKIIKTADERFEREVKICNEFSENTGIPLINKIEQFEKETIILEEYIDGSDLSELTANYYNDETKICSLLLEIITILEPVWMAKYVHRDLKPQNIRIKPDGSPVVLDFGIARALDEESITVSGGQPLSWYFASPEQYSGQKRLISYRTDFFCLGIIAYSLFMNSLPFGNNREEISQSFEDGNLKVKTGNEKIDNFCNAVFKINPSERPRDVESLIKYL